MLSTLFGKFKGINFYPFEYYFLLQLKKGSSIIQQVKSKILEGGEIHGGFMNLLLPIPPAAGGPVLSNIFNKIVDVVDDIIRGKGKTLTLEIPNQPPIP